VGPREGLEALEGKIIPCREVGRELKIEYF
jgi:hypothetical protein